MMQFLPSEYENSFDQLLQQVGQALGTNQSVLTALWPMRGHRYIPGKSMMIIGRAVNGWLPGWQASAFLDSGTREHALEEIRGESENESECPMKWVIDSAGPGKHYNTNRSAFWRIARKVVLALVNEARSDAPWSSHLAWTNLYKVAPAVGGNPSAKLRYAQFQTCLHLLRLELEAWAPGRVLVMAGKDWYEPFVEQLGIEIVAQPGDLVEQIGRFNGQHWVLAKHPQRKPEDPFLDQILSAFNNLK